MPKFCGTLHPKYKSPYISVIIIGVVSVLMILTNNIILVATMCAYAQITAYILGIRFLYHAQDKGAESGAAF